MTQKRITKNEAMQLGQKRNWIFNWTKQFSLPALVGIIDTSVIAAYVFQIDPSQWHVGTLLIKLFLVALYVRQFQVSRISGAFLLSILLLLAISAIQLTDPSSYAQSVGFALHFFLTLLLVKPAKIMEYCASASIVIGVSAIAHAFFCLYGSIISTYGRYQYYGANQANLGGEINAIGAFAAMIGLARPKAIIVVLLIISDEFLLQSRSGMLVALWVLVVLVTFDGRRQISRQRAAALFVGMFAALVVALAAGYTGFVSSTIGDAFLVNDQYRGINSGFSGRADLWAVAISLFESSPIIGHGFGYFDTIGYIGPHNIFLFALAQNGILGLLPIGLVLLNAYKISLKSLYLMCSMLSVLPLFMFNDRFLNLNPYPFLFYLVVLGFGQNVPHKLSTRLEVRSVFAPAFERLWRNGVTR
jgi:hypothetical protein